MNQRAIVISFDRETRRRWRELLCGERLGELRLQISSERRMDVSAFHERIWNISPDKR